VEPRKDAHSSDSPRKVDSFWAEQIGAARREAGIGAASPERQAIPPAKVSRAKLAWVLGWPPLFTAAFVASEVVHDPADEVEGSLSLGNGVSKTEWALFLVGFWGLVIWILGCLILLIGAALRSRSEGRRASPSRLRMEGTGWVETEEGGEPPK
jgi:hypothetical protein